MEDKKEKLVWVKPILEKLGVSVETVIGGPSYYKPPEPYDPGRPGDLAYIE